MIFRSAAWRHLDASFTEAYNFRQKIGKTPSYFLKKTNSITIDLTVWQSYVSKFLKVLEEKILPVYSNDCESLKKNKEK